MTRHTLRLFSLLFVFVSAIWLCGCATDSTEDNDTPPKPVDVNLTISMQGAASPANASSYRAGAARASSWGDLNAVPGEMMRHCFVVAVQDGKIAGVLVSDDYAEEKSYTERLTLRINPGNIGGEEKVRAVVEAAKKRNIPIRIGVNAGSLPKDLLEKYGHPTAEALVEAAWRHVRILEAMDYRNIKISLKAHDVPLTLEAYRLMAAQCDYPLHAERQSEHRRPQPRCLRAAGGFFYVLSLSFTS